MTDKRIVLDLETKKTFGDVGGRDAIDKLGISVVGVYRYETDGYEVFLEKDLGQLQNLLIDSSLIIGFNHIFFDMPVLQPYFSTNVTKLPCFDIMLDVQSKLGHRLGLDTIATATLGAGKIGTGLDAIQFYKEGRWEELKKYCLKDVEVTKDVFEFGLKNKKILYRSKFGSTIKEIKVDWNEHGKRKANDPETVASLELAQYTLF